MMWVLRGCLGPSITERVDRLIESAASSRFQTG